MKDFAIKHKNNFDLLCESFSPRLLLLSEENNDLFIETIINVINIMLNKDKENGNSNQFFIVINNNNHNI